MDTGTKALMVKMAELVADLAEETATLVSSHASSPSIEPRYRLELLGRADRFRETARQVRQLLSLAQQPKDQA